jgi:branched-chain amino acid transport system permease protein
VHFFLEYLVVGIVYGGTYAVTASGLVVTYATSGVFNFAHGAIGMMAAFTYWALHVSLGWPTIPAVVAVVLVLAPLTGAVIERVLVRGLEGAPVVATVGVTLGLMLAVIGAANHFWNPGTARLVPTFFAPNDFVDVLGVNVSYDQLTVLVVAVLVALGLWLFLHGTRAGISMRAVVDDRALVALTGRSPGRSAQLGWVFGASLAATGGVLWAIQIKTLDIEILTLLVVSAYAAAIFGRLKSLPLTFVGALALGIAVSLSNSTYLPQTAFFANLQLFQTTPMILLFVVLMVLPRGRLQTSAGPSRPRLKVASLRTSLIAGAALIIATLVVSGFLSQGNIDLTAEGMVLGLVLLSLVPLTGYAGQISLGQLSFAGLGAFAMGKVAGGASPLGLVAAVVLAAAVGVVVALPAIRLQGLYLALATLAFASGMDYAFFQNPSVMGSGSAFIVGRAPVVGLSFASNRSFLVFIAVVFALAGIGVLALRRGRFGRRLVAMSDSPAACATVGISLTLTKLVVFGLSAGLAGLAGALYGGITGEVTSDDFAMLASLTLVLLAAVWGVRSVTGALLAGLAFVLLPTLFPSYADVTYLAAGLGAIGLSRNPEGVVGDTVLRVSELLRGIRATGANDAAGGATSPMPAVRGTRAEETVGVAGPGEPTAAPPLTTTTDALGAGA